MLFYLRVTVCYKRVRLPISGLIDIGETMADMWSKDRSMKKLCLLSKCVVTKLNPSKLVGWRGFVNVHGLVSTSLRWAETLERGEVSGTWGSHDAHQALFIVLLIPSLPLWFKNPP